MIDKLSIEQIRELWGKTYNTEGKPDWSHIFPYYHDDIVFHDSIQRIEGIDKALRTVKHVNQVSSHGGQCRFP